MHIFSLLFSHQLFERGLQRMRSAHKFSIRTLFAFPQLHKRCCSYKNPRTTMNSKPPNILIYVGEYDQPLVKDITVNLLSCLHPDKYVVYCLKDYQVLKSPWKECAEVLVVLCDKIEDEVADVFHEYVEGGGKVLVFCSNLSSRRLGLACSTAGEEAMIKMKLASGEEVVSYHGKYNYALDNCEILATDNTGEAVLMKATYHAGLMVASEVNFLVSPHMLPIEDDKLKCGEESRLRLLKCVLQTELGCEVLSVTRNDPTPGYVLTERGSSDIANIREISLGVVEQGTEELIVPLLSDEESLQSVTFDRQSYFPFLKTKNLGHMVVFFPVVTSTNIPAEKLKDHRGVVVVAAQQTSGKGRGENVWISPTGCAMFTFPIKLSLTSRLGQRLSILQHMAALAVVHSIRNDSSYATLDLGLKWPNDVYFENDKKIGGVLVNTTIQGNEVFALIGIGVNVSNRRPTVCVNSVVEQHNAFVGDTLPLIPIEKLIAGTLTELEHIMDDFESNGSARFLELYYRYWLHKEQQVTISSIQTDAVIHGLDDYGFLIVQTVDGKRLTLQPDGNRFDMLKNLIVAKE